MLNTDPIATVEAGIYGGDPEILVTIQTDAWLANETTPNPRLQSWLDTWREQRTTTYTMGGRVYQEEPNEGELMAGFPAYVYQWERFAYDMQTDDEKSNRIEPREPTGFYGEGEPVHVFTPNNETLLSDDLEFVLWKDANGSHVIYRHADAYNGSGCATVADCDGCDGTELLDYARAQLGCDHCEASWDVEGSHVIDYCDGYGSLPRYGDAGDYPSAEGTTGVKGTLVIDSDERAAFCPVCGVGHLVADKF
jgi:hypothetical protein